MLKHFFLKRNSAYSKAVGIPYAATIKLKYFSFRVKYATFFFLLN